MVGPFGGITAAQALSGRAAPSAAAGRAGGAHGQFRGGAGGRPVRRASRGRCAPTAPPSTGRCEIRQGEPGRADRHRVHGAAARHLGRRRARDAAGAAPLGRAAAHGPASAWSGSTATRCASSRAAFPSAWDGQRRAPTAAPGSGCATRRRGRSTSPRSPPWPTCSFPRIWLRRATLRADRHRLDDGVLPCRCGAAARGGRPATCWARRRPRPSTPATSTRPGSSGREDGTLLVTTHQVVYYKE